MSESQILDQFEQHGKAAEFLRATGKRAAFDIAERRVQMAVSLYNSHPHLQDAMYRIGHRWRWGLIARVESARFLEQSDAQRGARC